MLDDTAPWDPSEEPPDDDPATPPDTDDQWWRDYQQSPQYLTDWPHMDAADRELNELEHLGVELPDAPDRATQLKITVGQIRARRAREIGHADLADFLAEHEPEYDWLVPGLLERGDRVIVTGQEGKGKSTLLRQFCVQVAAGIHPFTLEPIDARRTLLLDVENPRRLVRRALRPLSLSASHTLIPGFMVPVIWPEGLDLRQPDDVARLSDLIGELGTDLLVLGPSYKLASGDPTSEETAKTVTGVLDQLRTQHEFALILEAHQPYPASGMAKRAERPYGASLWSRWPEFGLHLADSGELRHWRGDRDKRDWPEALTRGGEWPWTAINDQRAVTFARILAVTSDAGRKVSLRDLADAVGGHASTIRRAIKANQEQYDALLRDLGEDPEQP